MLFWCLFYNSFNYFENINYELVLDSSELNIEIDKVRVSLKRTIYSNKKDDHSKIYKKFTKEIAFKRYDIDNKNKKHQINDSICYPQYNKYINIPDKIYEYLDNKKKILSDSQLDVLQLIPRTYGGLIAIDFFLEVKITYKKRSDNSVLKIIIEFYTNEFENKNKEINDKESNLKNSINDNVTPIGDTIYETNTSNSEQNKV